MIPSRKPLFALTAGDLMTPAVLTLPAEMRLPAAARMLHRQHVSGAPVVDSEGHCVGVLSTTDFMRWAEEHALEGKNSVGQFSHDMEWQMLEPEELPHDAVRDHMTRDPVTIVANTPLARMAQLMMDAHIHRLIVVDAEARPIGVVTTTDILGALVREDQATM